MSITLDNASWDDHPAGFALVLGGFQHEPALLIGEVGTLLNRLPTEVEVDGGAVDHPGAMFLQALLVALAAIRAQGVATRWTAVHPNLAASATLTGIATALGVAR